MTVALAFTKERMLDILIQYVPVNRIQLPQHLYEIILEHFLVSDPRSFLSTIRMWGDPSMMVISSTTGGRISKKREIPLYNLNLMMVRTEANLSHEYDPIVMEAQV